ncbi:MAG: enoyl-CoA hydratase/isomerase family protein [Hyphomicrobiales bacterium]|nr:enoyl-CoA hydratase/isomerase family protein [Hyphomicrobiales bacterium]MCP5371596.1 enoyl-CoA hydratase/isomerase family protein [Hyphomicrobiales bacterium]
MGAVTTIEHRGEVTVLTLNRPAARNALDAALRAEVMAALAAFNGDDARRALVLTGAGDRAFCAGQDLTEVRSLDAAGALAWQDDLGAYLAAFRDLDKPIVAAVNAAAAGAGYYTALLCDMRVGHPGIRMGQPEINVGVPSILGTRLMYLTLGHATTVDLTLTGRLVDGEEALRLGLVNELVPAARVLDRAVDLARELGAKPPLAMKLTKQALREMTQPLFDGALETGRRLQPVAYASGEPQRAMAAFLDRDKG